MPHFGLLHFTSKVFYTFWVTEFITFCVESYYILGYYYILRQKLLHFGLLLHFASIITFCGVTVELNVPLGFVSGNIEGLGETKLTVSLVPSRSYFQHFKSITDKTNCYLKYASTKCVDHEGIMVSHIDLNF